MRSGSSNVVNIRKSDKKSFQIKTSSELQYGGLGTHQLLTHDHGLLLGNLICPGDGRPFEKRRDQAKHGMYGYDTRGNGNYGVGVFWLLECIPEPFKSLFRIG